MLVGDSFGDVRTMVTAVLTAPSEFWTGGGRPRLRMPGLNVSGFVDIILRRLLEYLVSLVGLRLRCGPGWLTDCLTI